jgi:hypothetical protein
MNIKQALKEKNRLTKEIQETYSKILTYNSVEFGNQRPYSSKELMGRVELLTDELISLKTKIHKSNLPVYDKIFRLSELKNTITKIKNMDCTEGVANDYYSRNRENPPVRTSEISIVERDEKIKSLEKEIDSIQDYLDTHNQTTLIG